LLVSLHQVELMACDVSNAYLNAPCQECIWFVGGIEFGENAGKVVIVRSTLYGLKTSGAAWRRMLADTVESPSGLAFKHTAADPDVYIRPAVNKCGYQYYKMVFIYTGDILILSHGPWPLLDVLSKFYKLKKESTGHAQ
jgi:hypothetical protein